MDVKRLQVNLHRHGTIAGTVGENRQRVIPIRRIVRRDATIVMHRHGTSRGRMGGTLPHIDTLRLNEVQGAAKNCREEYEYFSHRMCFK
jgi:hypothetical protein